MCLKITISRHFRGGSSPLTRPPPSWVPPWGIAMGYWVLFEIEGSSSKKKEKVCDFTKKGCSLKLCR